MEQKVMLNVTFPKLPSSQFVFRSYKIMPRAQNAHAMVNAAFLFEFDTSVADKKTVKSCHICYWGINPTFIHAEITEKLLTGVDELYTNENLQKAIKSLQDELQPDSVLPDPSPNIESHLQLLCSIVSFWITASQDKINNFYKSGSIGLEWPLSFGSQIYQTEEKSYPISQAIPKYDGLIQCAGEAQYSNDIFSRHSVDKELWCAFVSATEVYSKIVGIDASKAF